MIANWLAKLRVKKGQIGSMPPVKTSDATWTTSDILSMVIFHCFCVSNWTVGSSLLSLGLSVWQAILCAVLGMTMATCAAILTGYVGARYRIAEPYVMRMATGYRLQRIAVFFNYALTSVWYSVQAFFGGLCLKAAMVAVVPRYYHMRNYTGSAVASNDLICIILFWILSLILHWPSIKYMRIPGKIGGVAAAAAIVALTIYSLSRAKGAGPLLSNPYRIIGIETIPRGADLTFACLAALSNTGGSTGVTSQSNYTRFARNTRTAVPAQIMQCALLCTVVVCGIIVTSAAAEFYPNEPLLWQPSELLMAIVRHERSPGARAAVFFASLALACAQFGINVNGNGYSNGVRLTTLFPRYIDIRRGTYVTAVLGLGICPWYIAGKASGFTRFLGGSAMLTAPLAALIICDFYIIRRRTVALEDLYLEEKRSVYFYTRGFNLRAVLAFICAVVFPLPGFVHAIANNRFYLPQEFQRIFKMNWPIVFCMTVTVYYVLCRIWPVSVITTAESSRSSVTGHPEETVNDENGAEATEKTPGGQTSPL